MTLLSADRTVSKQTSPKLSFCYCKSILTLLKTYVFCQADPSDEARQDSHFGQHAEKLRNLNLRLEAAAADQMSQDQIRSHPDMQVLILLLMPMAASQTESVHVPSIALPSGAHIMQIFLNHHIADSACLTSA